jgi:hypothetical protein
MTSGEATISEEEMMTSTSRKASLLLFTVLVGVSAVSASHTFDDRGVNTGFDVPEFESNQEILTELVAPFIFVFVLMQYTLSRALHFALDKPGRPETTKETTLLSLAIVTMLVPSPFWDLIRLSAESLGLLAVLAFAGLFLFVIYVMSGRG